MKNMSDMSDLEFNSIIVLITIPYLNTNALRLNVSAGNLAIILGLAGIWTPNWDLYIAPATNNEDVTHIKETLRTAIEHALSSIFNDIPKSAVTTTDELNIPIKAHRAAAERSQALDFSPLMTKISKGEGRYEIHFQNPNTPDTKAFPKGQMAIVVLEIITDAGVTPSLNGAFTAVFHTSTSVLKLAYTPNFYNKQVNLIAYYLSNRAEDGAHSPGFFTFIVGS